MDDVEELCERVREDGTIDAGVRDHRGAEVGDRARAVGKGRHERRKRGADIQEDRNTQRAEDDHAPSTARNSKAEIGGQELKRLIGNIATRCMALLVKDLLNDDGVFAHREIGRAHV